MIDQRPRNSYLYALDVPSEKCAMDWRNVHFTAARRTVGQTQQKNVKKPRIDVFVIDVGYDRMKTIVICDLSYLLI